MLLGDSGSGKSALLSSLAAGHNGLLVRASQLHEGRSLGERLHDFARRELSVEAPRELIVDALQSGDLRLLVDGVDELPRSRKAGITRALAAAIEQGALRRAVVASRAPLAAPSLPEGDEHIADMEMTPLRGEGVATMLRARLDRPVDDWMITHVRRVSAGNPLLVELHAETIMAVGSMPREPAELMHVIVSTRIRRLAGEHGVSGDIRGPLLAACKRLAVEIIHSDVQGLSESRVTEILAEHGIDNAMPSVARADYSFFCPVGRSLIGLRDRLVGEFLAALELHDDSDELSAR